ncbi:MAG: M14 family metallopeptidase [Acidiferrobacterales bacterium]
MMATSYPVNLHAPDITPYRAGNTGVDYVTSFDSGNPGPHVMLTAVVHGNELCGAITLDFLFKHDVRPTRGKLTFGFMNVAAFNRFDPADPEASRFVDEDFNRVWGNDVLEGSRESTELRRAREVRPIIDEVDYLLDIHSMQHPTVPLCMCGPTRKGEQLARAISFPEHVVSDLGHSAGRRMRDYGVFADESNRRNALLIECGQHWEPSSEVVAKEMALRFLAHYDLIDPDFVADHLSTDALVPQKVIEVTEPVTIKTDVFKFIQSYTGMEVIEQVGTLIGYDGDEEVRTPYDQCVLIMPSKRLRKGESAVRFGRIAE